MDQYPLNLASGAAASRTVKEFFVGVGAGVRRLPRPSNAFGFAIFPTGCDAISFRRNLARSFRTISIGGCWAYQMQVQKNQVRIDMGQGAEENLMR